MLHFDVFFGFLALLTISHQNFLNHFVFKVMKISELAYPSILADLIRKYRKQIGIKRDLHIAEPFFFPLEKFRMASFKKFVYIELFLAQNCR